MQAFVALTLAIVGALPINLLLSPLVQGVLVLVLSLWSKMLFQIFVHLLIEKTILCKAAMRLLNAGVKQKELRVRSDALDDQLQTMILSGHVVAYKDNIYSRRSFVLEDETARRIAEMLMDETPDLDITQSLEQVCEQFSLRLSEKQTVAVKAAFQHNLSIITGSPGTGREYHLCEPVKCGQY